MRIQLGWGEVSKLADCINRAYGSKRVSISCLYIWRSEWSGFNIRNVKAVRYKDEIVSVAFSRRKLYENVLHGYIGPVATLVSHRGKGLASYLISKILIENSKENLDTILFVEEGNPYFRGYLRFGFKPVSSAYLVRL